MTDTNFNKRPYFDDWDPTKRFSRILFRPTTVQTRELTQLQTMLQSQLAQVGNHLFKDGSVVIPGGLSVSNTPASMEFVMAGGATTTDIQFIEELYVEAIVTGVKARIIELSTATAPETMKCVMDMTNSGLEGTNAFGIGDSLVFKTYDTNGNEVAVAYGTVNTVGGAIVARMTAGTYFIRGLFVPVLPQTLVVDATANDTDHKVGFTVEEVIVTEAEDESLYSNAQGTNNVKAAGAHRLRIDLTLTRVGLDDVVDNFIELSRIKGGIVQSLVTTSTYNLIEDSLAQRTYETNGDYNVSAHQIDLREHLKEDNNGGVYTAEEGGDESKLVAVMKPGISYVRGRRIQNLGEQLVVIDKARDTAAIQNSPVAVSTGSYLITKASKGVPVPSKTIRYKLCNASGVAQGTAICISSERQGSEFRVYLRDVIYTGDRSTVTQLRYEDSGITRFSSALESNQFSQASSIQLMFDLPVTGVKTLAVGGTPDVSFSVMRAYSVTLDANGNASLSAPSGYSFSPEYTLYAAAQANGSTAQIDISSKLTLSGTPAGSAVTLSLGTGNASQQLLVMALMIRTTAAFKTKTLVSTSQVVTLTNAASIALANCDGQKLLQVVNASNQDVTSQFVMDGGQRDNGYYPATLKTANGVAMTGNLTVSYSYYSHSSGDFFCVDSYSSVDYKDIPEYTSTSNGNVYDLADTLDFRPRIINGLPDSDMVRPNTAVTLDLEYFLPRIDTVYLTDTGVFSDARGISSNDLISPNIPDNGMRLYNLTIPPYTFSIDSIAIETIDNRRYTMRDIGKLEQRIANVEYYTTLSQLESSAATTQVFDPVTGLPRYKNGIAADPFKDYRLIDDLSVDWAGAIDVDNGGLSPYVQQNALDLKPVNWPTKDGIVTCASTLDASVTQNYATTTINVNPYAVFNWTGYLQLTPNTDYWFENYYVAPRIVNETINTRGTVEAGTVYGSWRTVSMSDRVWEPHGAGGVYWGYRYRTTVSTRDVSTYTLTDSTTTSYAGEAVVETQVIPYMRASIIGFKATGLRPNTTMYAFFSGRSVQAQCVQNGRTVAATLITDGVGTLEGNFFVPATDALKFNTGDNVFRLTDNANDSRDEDETVTNAEAVHKSFGKKQGIQKTYVNTRVLGYTVSTTSETTSNEALVDTWRDPIAQSFMVSSTNGGEYISAFDVFFSTKSRDVPVTLEIREMENGLPSSVVVSRKTLAPANVLVSGDSSLATRFTLDYPVFLNANTEFALVLLANTQDYNAYIAEMGKKNLLSSEFIAKQPYTGVFFTSSNGSTWSPNQLADLKFRVYRDLHTAGDNVVTFAPSSAPKIRPLGSNMLTCVKSSSTIKVFAPGHGLAAGENVTISGATDGCGFTAANINTAHVVTDASYNYFSFVMTTSADSNGTIGGDTSSFLGNYIVNMFYASVTRTALSGSTLMLEYRYRDRSSNALSSWAQFESDTDVTLPTEGIYRVVGDFQVRATMSRSESNPYVAPQIDGDDFTVILNSFGVDPNEDAFIYPTKDVNFDNPCTTAKFYVGALLPSQSSMVLQIKPIRSGEISSAVAWQTVSPTSPLVNDGSSYFEYEYDYTTTTTNPFVGLKTRILIRGNRTVPPKLKDFRLIALA